MPDAPPAGPDRGSLTAPLRGARVVSIKRRKNAQRLTRLPCGSPSRRSC